MATFSTRNGACIIWSYLVLCLFTHRAVAIEPMLLAGWYRYRAMYFIFFTLLFTCDVVLAGQDTGAPAGFMADCPGMNYTTEFSEDTKRSLKVVVVRPSSGFFGSSETSCKLGAEGAPCAAKHLNLKKKTQVLISGYMDASFSPLVRVLTSSYLAQKRNVIIVEIFPILVRTYPIAARVTKPLGQLLGELLSALTRRGLSPDRIELVGGSLGAHIASFAAVRYRQLTGYKPYRITGLDPAGPCFRNVAPTERLHPEAAQRVDVLHTNIDGFGIADQLGHIDFYANGGEYQPSMVGSFILPCLVLCSHVRAGAYWIVAIRFPEKFLAVRCDSVASARHGDCYEESVTTNVLGPDTDFSRPGIYYLPTAEIPPYYIGENGLTKRNLGVNNYLHKTAPDGDITI